MKITRDEIAKACVRSVVKLEKQNKQIYFGSGFQEGVKYAQSKLKNNGGLGNVINTYKPNCSECGDRGLIYNKDGSKNRTCACHY